MDEPWNQDRIKYYEEILKEHNIYYSINLVVNTNKDKPLIIKKSPININKFKTFVYG